MKSLSPRCLVRFWFFFRCNTYICSKNQRNEWNRWLAAALSINRFAPHFWQFHSKSLDFERHLLNFWSHTTFVRPFLVCMNKIISDDWHLFMWWNNIRQNAPMANLVKMVQRALSVVYRDKASTDIHQQAFKWNSVRNISNIKNRRKNYKGTKGKEF